MTGDTPLETISDVEQAWIGFAASRAMRGLRPFVHAPERNAPTKSRQTVDAYVSDSRWVADCLGGPHGTCRGGIACWPEHEYACCLDCGTIYKVEFPPTSIRALGEVALLGRPENNRHWRPREQTPEELRAENDVHGYKPTDGWKLQLIRDNPGLTAAQIDAVAETVRARSRKR